ncbi:hypothetical protein CHU98_g9755 [Xylaria longipes]|nr:hypothetical protein CHU98_g9755 [Xylaria longipes]
MLPICALDYLADTRHFQCKLYQDRVYSILSLFNPQLLIGVDYDCSKEELREQLSGALIEVGDSRTLLSTHRKSWRVDWDEAPNDLTGPEVQYLPRHGAVDDGVESGFAVIGEVTKTSRTKLGSEASDAKAIKRRWDDIMTELEQQLYEKESGAWPAIHL